MVVDMAHIAGFPLEDLLLAAPSGASPALGLRTLLAKSKRSTEPGQRMTAVVFDVNLSLDGFVAAAGITPDQPLGEGGEILSRWASGPDVARTPKPPSTAGALISGRRTYDLALPNWGAGGPHPPTPVFVVTHTAPEASPPDSVYTFVTDGVEAALERARAAAGDL